MKYSYGSHSLQTKKEVCISDLFKFLGWQDSNLRMAESESATLPLGDTPILLYLIIITNSNQKIKRSLFLSFSLKTVEGAFLLENIV